MIRASTTSPGVAVLPRGAVGRALTRARARLCAAHIDAALAEGADPWSRPELLERASRLVALGERRKVAGELEQLVTTAEIGWYLPSSVRLRRRAVLGERRRLVALAARLHAPAPVPAAVVARLRLLLTDGSSPVFAGGRPVEGLTEELDGCWRAIGAVDGAEDTAEWG